MSGIAFSRLPLVLLAVLLLGLPARAQGPSLSALVDQSPAQITRVAPDTFLVDFGKVAVGNLLLKPPSQGSSKTITVRLGETLKNGRIDRKPPGSVRFAEIKVSLDGKEAVLVAPPADRRNTRSPAVLTPPAWGVITPFRWVEVDGWPGELTAAQITRRAAFDHTWSDSAASFHSSEPALDKIWDLSHYSIKATTFAGVFVDGDRERISYEADAYLNQLGYYAGDADPAMPRATFDRLVKLPTWPSEWAPHMVFIAHADWMQTGDLQWLKTHYEVLKNKLLSERVGTDGLVTSSPEQIRHADIVDWPKDERDGYVFTSVNTVVNAFRLRALHEMSELANALGKADEATHFAEQERTALVSFQHKLFDPARHLYRDGVGTDHASQHANFFPLAFGLVPAEERSHIARWLVGRGMATSVYGAQYLLEALFENDEAAAAVALMTAPGDRSWKHMVDSGTTITWEAWDGKYKPNQDWTHAWGAAPANLLPRFVLGAQPLTPGWGTALIQPHISGLRSAEGRLPTPHGEVAVSWSDVGSLRVELNLPAGMTAKIKLPALPGSSEIKQNGHPVAAHHEGDWWVLDREVSGTATLEEPHQELMKQ